MISQRWSSPVRLGAPLVAALVSALAGCANAGGNTFAPPPLSSSSSSTGVSVGGGNDAGANLSALGSDASLGGIGDASSIVSSSSTFTGPLAGPFTDFPSTPVLDMPDGGGAAAPANAPQLFGPASQGAMSGGPCLLEPEVGSIYPNNWLRPRFAWIGPSGANLFELRLHVNNQTNDLVVYTTATQWTMPKTMWDALRADSQDVSMTITIRSGQLGGGALSNEALGSSGSVGIAPVGAPGAIVYWAIIGGQSGTGILQGFSVGDETVETVLTGPQVEENAAPAGNRACIGCHAATPDGLGVGFQAEWLGPNGGYNNTIATIGQDASPGGVPSFLSPAAGTELATLAGAPIYSGAHWTTGDRIEILSNTGTLTWVDLEATGANGSGVLPRTLGADAGDLQGATSPTWSHDGSTIVYTSLPTGGIVNGRPANGPMDLYAVSYNAKAGGNATPVAGASDPFNDEFYPAFSPDDQYIAFDKLEGNGGTYDAPGDEIYIVPSGGGKATRLNANDPPACTGASSPGVTNSWPRWSPSAQLVSVLNNTTYYWIVFSSTRPNLGNIGQQAVPQLYISLVTVDPSGNATSYHSLYLWNQPSDEDNHLPAWDVFQIPPVSTTIPR